MFVSNFPETTGSFCMVQGADPPCRLHSCAVCLAEAACLAAQKTESCDGQNSIRNGNQKRGIVWVCKCWCCCCWWCCCCCCCCCWEHDDNPPELVVAYFQTNPPTKHHGIYWLQQETSGFDKSDGRGFHCQRCGLKETRDGKTWARAKNFTTRKDRPKLCQQTVTNKMHQHFQ